MSGYCVAEWLPQIERLVTVRTGAPALAATWPSARFWSSRVMAENWCGANGVAECPALWAAIRQLVLAGLPTTSTRTSRAALAARALPWTLKMAPLASSRSRRSMPLLRGRAPTRSAMSASPKAASGSELMVTPARRGKAQSSSSIATPPRAPRACRDLQQVQGDRLVRPEHRPARDPEQEAVGDLACSPGDGNLHGRLGERSRCWSWRATASR